MLKVDTPASGAAPIAASTRPTGGIRKHRNITCSCFCREQEKRGDRIAVLLCRFQSSSWELYRRCCVRRYLPRKRCFDLYPYIQNTHHCIREGLHIGYLSDNTGVVKHNQQRLFSRSHNIWKIYNLYVMYSITCITTCRECLKRQ